MAPNRYDVIVVRRGCAGSPTATPLARAGLRVLLVDRATFPSDTMSTHILHPQGAAVLARWGLVDRLTSTGCPPIDTYALDFGPFTISGSPGIDGSPVAYCPRARQSAPTSSWSSAAAEAGVEVREGFSVDEVLLEGDRAGRDPRPRQGRGTTSSPAAQAPGGVDGLHSFVARVVAPSSTTTGPTSSAATTATGATCPMNGRFETYIREGPWLRRGLHDT